MHRASHTLALCALLLATLPLHAEGNAQSMLKADDFDTNANAFSEWVDGATRTDTLPKEGPRRIVWTQGTRIEGNGISFGDSNVSGPRYLRVGFKNATAIGSVIVRGGGRLTVLKPGAAYPGDVTHENDWLPAERIKDSTISQDEVEHDEYAIWTLPPGTSTRALRFSHTSQAADTKYAGWLGGALVLAERVTNIAPQALIAASSREEEAGKLINSRDEGWKAWDNGKEGAADAVSTQHPEWLMLVWHQPVSLNGLEAIWAGFGAAEVQTYTGPADKHPREAGESDWNILTTSSIIKNGYPQPLWPNALAFNEPVTTRAIRLRITAPTTEGGHLNRKTKDGHRIWLGELMALHPLGTDDLTTALLPAAHTQEGHPPIAVRFHLPEAGYVTLAIDDADGSRVRNLISETRFPAGDNVAWWDGADDWSRDRDAAKHGLYHIPAQPVAPGMYHARGLFHKGLDLRYEFSIYNSGTPAWETADTSGGWLTNHTPPQAVVFVPGDKSPAGKPLVYIGSAVSEGGAGLAWVDLDGRKIGGRGWIGGNWTAAPNLARDTGTNPLPDVYAYVASAWTSSASNRDQTHGELRFTGLTAKGDKAVLKYPFTPPAVADGDHHWISQLGGIAVHDGLLVASLNKIGKLLVVDARAGKALGETALPSPRGLAFDAQGRLLALSANKLLRFPAGTSAQLPAGQVLVSEGLEDPQGITIDAKGCIYISDYGTSHQVKVFSPEGRLLRTIGHPGAPAAGPYDKLHMNHPHGLAIDDQQQLWVAEEDFQPKRVSVWTLDGQFVRAFYGPGRYGGGGSLDPQDKTRFYYDGIEFKLDWSAGTNEPAAVFNREGGDEVSTLTRAGPPQTPIYAAGRQYMTNCYNSNPTGGHPNATIWLMDKGVAVPVAAFGRAQDWELLKGEPFRPRWPQGIDPTGDPAKNPACFVWSDLNGDHHAQPEEVTIVKGKNGGVMVGQDLSFLLARLDDRAVRFVPARITPQGVPVYDLGAGSILADGTQNPASSGGDQALVSVDGWTLLTVAPASFAREGLGGLKDGRPLWNYPSLWPGLHASHEAPVPDRPGEIIGTTRLLGDFIDRSAGPLWCVNGNMGTAYLFTADGLFVSQLFQDSRTGKPWSMPAAERNMRLNDVTLHDENFFPTITQTRDGKVYLCDGARTSLVRIDGLDTLHRLPDAEVKVTAEDLANAATWQVQEEAKRQAARGSGTLVASLRKQAPVVDGRLDDWKDADWAVIDRRGTAANFNSDSKPYDITGAVAIAGDRLYAAFRTQDADLLNNSGETPIAPFKTGGCLDLMIGTDASADPKRPHPVAGDERLLVTQVKGKTVAMLYQAVVPGTKEPVPFSSPARTITLDRVDDVSSQVQLAMSVEKNDKGKVAGAFYELSIPLSALGLTPTHDKAIKADIGILRGNGFQTLQRVYWNNKATAITADVPSEAELTPALWGTWQFRAEP